MVKEEQTKGLTDILLREYPYYIDQTIQELEVFLDGKTRYHEKDGIVLEDAYIGNPRTEIVDLKTNAEKKYFVERFKHDFLAMIYDCQEAGIDINMRDILKATMASIDYLFPEGAINVNVHQIVTYLGNKGLFTYENSYDPNSNVRITEKGIQYITTSEDIKQIRR